MSGLTHSIHRALARIDRRRSPNGERVVIGALLVSTVAVLSLLVLTIATPMAGSRTVVVVFALPAVIAVGYVLLRLTLPRHFDSTRDRLVGRAVAKERERFARDLHDLLGHRLSVIAVTSELARRQLDAASDRAREQLGSVIEIARQAQSDVRAVAHSYPTSSLQEELASAYTVLEAAGFHCRVNVACGDLPPRIGEALANVVREAVTNVVRHASTGGCDVQLVERDGRVALTMTNDGTITNDGSGPGTDSVIGPASNGRNSTAGPDFTGVPDFTGGQGIANMRARAAAIGGTVTVGPNSAGQFRLRVTVPLSR